MKTRTSVRTLSILAGGCLVGLALSGGALAQSHGSGGHAVSGGGGHSGFSGGSPSYHGGSTGGYGYRGGYAYPGGYGYRGGYAYPGGYYHGGYGYPGYRGGYGYPGYYRGYYGWGGWGCCGWGWGWGGLGLGVYVATLPLYYSTYYWGGVPYYYANDVYYTWDPNASQYVTVAPPAGLQTQAGASPQAGAPPQAAGSYGSGTELMAYPKNGQSAEQQAKDKFECHQWAVGQTGFDPTTGSATAGAANRRNDYMRAQAACLEGRGYSVQ